MNLTVTFTKEEDVIKIISAVCSACLSSTQSQMTEKQAETAQVVMSFVETQVIKTVKSILSCSKPEYQLTFDIDEFIGQLFEVCMLNLGDKKVDKVVDEGAKDGASNQAEE